MARCAAPCRWIVPPTVTCHRSRKVTAQRMPSQLVAVFVRLLVVYVTLFLLFCNVTFAFTVEHVPAAFVVHDRVVDVPPVTSNVTTTPATGWPFWSATLTSTHELHEENPTDPCPDSDATWVTTDGAALLTVTSTGADVAVLPVASVARAAMVCDPFDVAAVFQLVEYGAIVSVPMTLPSTRNSIDAMPLPGLGSEPSAVTEIVPDTVPPGGLVITAD